MRLTRARARGCWKLKTKFHTRRGFNIKTFNNDPSILDALTCWRFGEPARALLERCAGDAGVLLGRRRTLAPR
eukprot:9518447-Lingulodinium_polyedra.AAC.1